MDKSNLRIKFFCRSFDLRLYRLSRGLYESLGYECVRLTDQTADGYFYTMLADKNCDIAINVDEDCFITNFDAVMELLDYVIENKVANAGCPDGGGAVPRGANPIVTNPFFNIFDLRMLREKFSVNNVKNFDYQVHIKEMIEVFPKEMLYEGRNFNFDWYDSEPYYPYFFWQAYNTKTLYLHSKLHPDGWTTILYNHKGVEMCRHTWLARFYSVPSFLVNFWQANAGKQKQRIDSVINESYAIRGIEKPKFGIKDNFLFFLNKITRWMIKVPQRVAGWPKKIKKKIAKFRNS